MPSRSSSLTGKKGFQGPRRETPSVNQGKAFQTKGTTCAKALRHEAGFPLVELCVKLWVRSEGYPAGERLERRQNKSMEVLVHRPEKLDFFQKEMGSFKAFNRGDSPGFLL